MPAQREMSTEPPACRKYLRTFLITSPEFSPTLRLLAPREGYPTARSASVYPYNVPQMRNADVE